MNDELDPIADAAVQRPRNRKDEVPEMEWKAQQACIDAAEYALRHLRGRKCTVADVTRLLDLASKLARRSAGMKR